MNVGFAASADCEAGVWLMFPQQTRWASDALLVRWQRRFISFFIPREVELRVSAQTLKPFTALMFEAMDNHQLCDNGQH